jgi:preprotein translocase subunit SecG
VALILLLMIQAKSSRGLRAALGESELDSPDDMTLSQ